MPRLPLDESYEPRPWACQECKSILGVVMRDNNRVRRLWVFYTARHAEQVPPAYILRSTPRGMFRIHGLDSASRPGGVECSHCGCINDWKISSEAFERLMSHYPRKAV